mmetsp:Transcript_4636/g.8205  ORF Transcript_4636/g.8205 Transcript_4636/m.8205 type:complete len:1282 (-) Transcript_4636:1719-5564(-)|eukprot:CAMPEP_0203763142 /NCGR_PEP_ID=MMETSP0098-20131031/15810_1 /ASSEMBLY_ACC=CAM_ASM_000208 /TAXON_ID=96639 /ORGANISM=" , Strain NY0313808BC1" /LENGTH=1281 /DNA_ID=CAMNT_0050657751 /DNA_START=117 /DNA_END=3962 /DNA_ORIENTATION=-
MGKKKAAGKAAVAPRCPVDGCKVRLQGDNRAQCTACAVIVCPTHQYPSDHACKTGATRGSAPPPPPTGSTAVKLEKKKDDVKAGALLNSLVAATSAELLDELISFGSAGARYESSVIVSALSLDQKSVRSALEGPVGEGMAECALERGDLDKVCALLEAHLVGISGVLSSSEEARAVGIAILYGVFLRSAPDMLVNKMDLCIRLLDVQSEKATKVVASRVLFYAAAAQASPPLQELDQVYDSVFKVEEGNDVLRNGRAAGVAALIGGCGLVNSAKPLADKLAKRLKSSKDVCGILGTMRIVFYACKELGAGFIPYLQMIDFVEVCLKKVYDKVGVAARSATKKALIQVMDKLDPRGVRKSVSLFLEGLTSSAWRIKQVSLQLLGALAKRRVPEMFRDLPIIVPAVMECVKDTKKQVGDAASDCLDNLGGMITNAETANLLPWLLDALKNPEKVELCLDELMDMTFVNSIDAQSLGLIIPVVVRGLRDGTAEVKLKASITAGNVCSLVADVHDLRPFFAELMMELKKLLDHSRPRVREHALKAKESLQQDLSFARRKSSRDQQNNCILDASVTQSLADSIHECAPKGMDPFVLEYLVSTAKMLLFDLFDDTDDNIPRSLVLKQVVEVIEDGVVPLFNKQIEDKESDEFASDIAESIVKALWVAQGKVGTSSEVSTADEKDYIVYLPSIILAFASRLLLQRTGLFLERAHRYAFVGMNGVGKTTLLNRIAARDINGFPKDVTVYYVQHEIMDEDKDLTVLGYMQRTLEQTYVKKKKKRMLEKRMSEVERENQRRRDMEEALEQVGFSETLRGQTVSSLSGGWRMRLAIARSMLYNADLLLLDEPTNHLDVDAIAWLQDYLVSLKDTTIGVVSHDYDFVGFVATDIIHIADLKLGYYPCTFKEFQKLRPEVVEALPKKDDDNEGGGTALDLLKNAAHDEKAAALVASNIKPINFPEGCKLDGIAHRGKPIATMKDVFYRYPDTERYIISNISLQLTLNSRVALIGANGAGKSTLLKLLVGELEIDEKNGDKGKVWKHHNLRTAYIAQHSMHHLEEHIEMTPCQYIQVRFWEGQDKEVSKKITTKMLPEDEEKMGQIGEICEIISRVVRGKKLFYEIRKTTRRDLQKSKRHDVGGNRDFKSLEELEELGKTKPHVIKMVRLFDEKLKVAASGADLRPLTTPEMIKHLEEFGINSDLAQRKIRWMSGGQKSRLVLAAAMWTRPHVIQLDEPTNYLDVESLAALTFALQNFRGGVVLISHHDGFVNAIAKEKWHLENGTVRVEMVSK